MTLLQARKLRDHLRANGVRCTVPLKGRPDRYVVKAWMEHESRYVEFATAAEWNAYAQMQRQRFEDWCRDHGIGRDTRTPLERMIDEACGVPR